MDALVGHAVLAQRHRLLRKPLGQPHFLLDPEWTELVLGDASESDIVFLEQRGKGFLAHFIQLLSLAGQVCW